jgi:DNA repair exonuclease SbcCD ATPase subunit
MSGEVLGFTRQLELAVVQCCTCGVEYGIPKLMKEELLAKRAQRSTTCPNGHSWHYTGKTSAEKLAEAEQRVSMLEQQIKDVAEHAREQAERLPGKRKVYETSMPRDECPVCHLKFIRLSTHRTHAKHWGELRAV